MRLKGNSFISHPFQGKTTKQHRIESKSQRNFVLVSDSPVKFAFTGNFVLILNKHFLKFASFI
ncbi:hypothetical protein D0817_13750 [Flavobacterium cupreum]|uniref:Uncharacterized protein n=1 Tax=Flavobacterium cupreum TaxID=2133766 RepID=A0A434A5R8_9FLAO|nr:hypothetical protein D0817_13750 [Flavobacterium cupreum]